MQLTWGASCILLGIAIWFDLKERRIPNWLTVSGMCMGLLLQIARNGFAGGIESIEGLILGFALLVLLFLRGGMGAGDVKLLMAVGALTGPQVLLYSFLYGAIIGGLISLAVLFRKKLLSLSFTLEVSQGSLTGISIPYAVPIACGVVVEMIGQITHLF